MKKFRTLLSLLLALTLVFSCVGGFAAEDDEDENDAQAENEIVSVFADVDENTTVGKAITQLAMLGIVTGYPDGTFLPEGSITRAEFAVICARLNGTATGLPSDAITGFSDLDSDDAYSWARPYVHMAVGQGMISGFEDGTFRAGEPVTYEQAVSVLMRMKGYGDICESETKRQQELNSNLTWSVGYITIANQVRLLINTNSNETVRSQPVTRGNVAVLAYNSFNVTSVQQQGDVYVPSTSIRNPNRGSGGGGGGGGGSGDSNLTTFTGTVTATFISAVDDPDTDLSRYEIVLDGDAKEKTYELTEKAMKKVGTYELLGQRVRGTYDKDDDRVTDITINTPDSSVTTIYSGYVNKSSYYYNGIDENGRLEYCVNPEEERVRAVSLGNYNVIFNGKYVKNFRAEDLDDPDSPYYFTSGMIELIDVGSNPVAKISSYKNYVIKSINDDDNVINLLYRTGSDAHLDFDVNGSSNEYVRFNRGDTEIERIRDLKLREVLSVLTSPEDLPGTGVRITEVTGRSLTGAKVTGRGGNIAHGVQLNNTLYRYNYEYINYDPDTGNDAKYDLATGDENITVYFDHIGQIASVAVSASGSGTGATSWKYGYLLTASQADVDVGDKNYNTEFYLLDELGNEREIGSKSKIKIDDVSYSDKDKDILSALRTAADKANEAYIGANGDDVKGQLYQQPVRYKLTSAGLLDELDTVETNSSKSDNDLSCDFKYNGLQTYSSTGTRFEDFSVNSATKVIYVPDNRNDFDSYTIKTYSSMFASGKGYHVEAYNVDKSNRDRAALVLVYKQNDNMTWGYGSSFMIVTDMSYGDTDSDYNKLTGYVTTKTSVGSSTRTYELSSDISESDFDEIGRGDIVRFLTNSAGRIAKIDLWFDASDPAQKESFSSLDEAIAARTLVYKSSTSGDPEPNDDISSAFRLAYGTVTDIETADMFITVSPTLTSDNIEMETDDTLSGNSVIRHKYGSSSATTSSKPVFYRSRNGGAVSRTTMSQAIEDGRFNTYKEADSGASRVITYTTGNTESDTGSGYFGFIYIVE